MQIIELFKPSIQTRHDCIHSGLHHSSVSSTAVLPTPAAISPGIFFLFLVPRLILMFHSWNFSFLPAGHPNRSVLFELYWLPADQTFWRVRWIEQPVSALNKLKMKKHSERRKHCARVGCSRPKVQTPPAHPPIANTQTGQITIHCASKLSVQCNKYKLSLTRCNANAKIPNQNGTPSKVPPGAAAPDPLPTATVSFHEFSTVRKLANPRIVVSTKSPVTRLALEWTVVYGNYFL